MERGLELHDELATKDLRPFHSKMETCFADMKARVTGEERKLARPKDLEVRTETMLYRERGEGLVGPNV